MTSCNEIEMIDLTNDSSDSEADEVIDITDQEMTRKLLMEKKNNKKSSNVGIKLFRTGQYFRALSAFNASINVYKGYAADWYFRSKVHQKMKSYTEAIKDAKHTIRLNAKSFKYFNWLLQLRLEIGQCDKCFTIIKIMKDSFPLETQKQPFKVLELNVIRLNDLLDRLRNMDSENCENHEKGLEDIRAALKIAPACMFLLLAETGILIKTKDYVEARLACVRVFHYDPENATAMYYQSIAFYQMCKFNEALCTANDLSRRDPINQEYDTFLKGMTVVIQEFTGGKVFQSEGNLSEAKESYNKIIAMLTSVSILENKKLESMCYCELAQIEFEENNIFESLKLCNKATYLDEMCVDAMVLKADIYTKQNKLEEAVKELKFALEIEHRANISCKLNQLRDLMNHYTVLGLESSASPNSIKRAYKKALLEYHPDKNPDASSLELEKNKKKLENVFKAYSILSDSKKRKVYDQEINKNGKSYDRSYMSCPYTQF